MRNIQRTKRRLPTIWLMTDERLGNSLTAIVRRLPYGSGVIFRHYSLKEHERKKLFLKLRRIAIRRGHIILFSGSYRHAINLGADGVHDRSRMQVPPPKLLYSAPVHNVGELSEIKKTVADMVLISPVYPTPSHPERRALGPTMSMRIARQARQKQKRVVALGGMSRQRMAMMDRRVIHGFAAISALA